MTTPRPGRIAHPGRARAVLGVLTAFSLVLAVYLLAFPRHFYDEFPLVASPWLPPLGPYSDHVLRDYGSMNLGAAAGAVYAGVTLHPQALRAVALVFVAGSLPHAVYHATMWRMSGVVPATVQAVLLAALAVLALGLLPLSRSSSGDATPSSR